MRILDQLLHLCSQRDTNMRLILQLQGRVHIQLSPMLLVCATPGVQAMPQDSNFNITSAPKLSTLQAYRPKWCDAIAPWRPSEAEISGIQLTVANARDSDNIACSHQTTAYMNLNLTGGKAKPGQVKKKGVKPVNPVVNMLQINSFQSQSLKILM